MSETYDPNLKAHVTADGFGRVRSIRHSQQFWPSDAAAPVAAASGYLQAVAPTYGLAQSQLANLHARVSYAGPTDAGPEYRLSEERSLFDSTTVGFQQTAHGIPVWSAGIKVTVKQGPNRVVRSVDTSHDDVEVELPSEDVFDRYRRMFSRANALNSLRDAGEEEDTESEDSLASELSEYVAVAATTAPPTQKVTRLIRGRFWIYRYRADQRFAGTRKHDRLHRLAVLREEEAPSGNQDETGDTGPAEPYMLDLPSVPASIEDGKHYVVAEITFLLPDTGDGRHFPWRALVELNTGAVLYLRALAANVDGHVFLQDPPTKTGDTSLDSGDNNATLNPQRDTVTLPNLDPPVGGNQALTGTWATVGQTEGPDVAAPTEPTGTDLLYDTRTNDFASVSGYFHVDRVFRVMEDLGFNLGTYFANTTFPVPVDIRCFDYINAHCVGNGTGGIGHTGYGLMDTGDTTNPLGRACDPRVHWHELAGHGILYEAVDSPNLGFTHSCGDGLSGIYFDPDSNLWGVDGTPLGKPGDLRFTYVPWHPTLHRRFDRDVADGWAWNGSRDDGGYGSEEIIATTLFNAYRAIGGDSSSLSRRRFASRMAMYLIFRAIGNLTPATDPNYARDFAGELMATDELNWTSEGVFGGAYNKVIRWAFEKQGDYQNPLVLNGSPADGTINSAGDPPDQDVYIDDGRGGEYQYQAVHWHTTDIWNRRNADGLTGHEEPALGEVNHAYVKVKNRGTQTAHNVVVYGYHTAPGAGLLWPGDFEAFTTPSISVGSLAGNSSAEQIVGPFEWTPNINAYGHDCMLMVVTADGDPSNVDKFTTGEVIPEWRLVPNDNNVGQRNVHPVPGGGGLEGLMAGLNGFSMWVGNPNPKRAQITLDVALPHWLVRSGWKLDVEGLQGGAVLKPGERRELVLRLQPGSDFSKADVVEAGDTDINVLVLADGSVMGGMTYRIDPEISEPYNKLGDRPDHRPEPGRRDDCADVAADVLDCLGIPSQNVKQATIKEVIVSFKLHDEDC